MFLSTDFLDLKIAIFFRELRAQLLLEKIEINHNVNFINIVINLFIFCQNLLNLILNSMNSFSFDSPMKLLDKVISLMNDALQLLTSKLEFNYLLFNENENEKYQSPNLLFSLI